MDNLTTISNIKFGSLKKLLQYEILNFLPTSKIRKFREIKIKKLFTYFLNRRRQDLIKTRAIKTRSLLIKKQNELKKIKMNKQVEYSNKFYQAARMLIFRSAIIDSAPYQVDKFNIPSEEYKDGLNKVKKLIKLNTDDLINIKHSTKEINEALVPELVYRTNSKIFISKSELIRIIKLENKLRLSSHSKKRNDYFFGNRLMSEIDQDFIEEALLFYGYNPYTDDSLKGYHLACGRHINNPEIKELVVWMKYDKMRKSTLNIGQEPIYNNIEVYNLSKQNIQLKDLILENIPNIVVCGSYS